MKTPTPFPIPKLPRILTPHNDAIERMKRNARTVLDLMEIPMTFEEQWHVDVKNAIEGMITDMLKIVESETGPDLRPRVKA